MPPIIKKHPIYFHTAAAIVAVMNTYFLLIFIPEKFFIALNKIAMHLSPEQIRMVPAFTPLVMSLIVGLVVVKRKRKERLKNKA